MLTYLFFFLLIIYDDIGRVKGSYSPFFLNKETVSANFISLKSFWKPPGHSFCQGLFVCAIEELLVFLEFIFHIIYIQISVTSNHDSYILISFIDLKAFSALSFINQYPFLGFFKGTHLIFAV